MCFVMLDHGQSLLMVRDWFRNQMEKRTKDSLEFWMLDISGLGPIGNVAEAFKDLPLDYNDDVYLYDNDKGNDLINIWEVYRSTKAGM